MYLLWAARPRTKSSPKMACRSNFRPFIKVLLSFFIRSPLSLFLSPFLSFIPGLSHTTTQTAASSHLLTDADAETAAAAAVGYYERAAFNTNYSSPVWIHLESLHICLVCGAGQCTMTKLPLWKGIHLLLICMFKIEMHNMEKWKNHDCARLLQSHIYVTSFQVRRNHAWVLVKLVSRVRNTYCIAVSVRSVH